jgi:hypothetical protein
MKNYDTMKTRHINESFRVRNRQPTFMCRNLNDTWLPISHNTKSV